MSRFLVSSPNGWSRVVDAPSPDDARRIAMEEQHGPARQEIVGEDRNKWKGDGLSVSPME